MEEIRNQDQQIEDVQQNLYQIQETMKIGNGYDVVLNSSQLKISLMK